VAPLRDRIEVPSDPGAGADDCGGGVRSGIIWTRAMTITLPLQPSEEAKLTALAQAKGVSTNALVREMLDKLLADVPEVNSLREPTRSLRGLLAKYGPAPSAEEIDQNRAEMFANFACD